MIDPRRPITEEELTQFERVAVEFRQTLRVADASDNPGKAEIESFALMSMRLVSEVRRLQAELTLTRRVAGKGATAVRLTVTALRQAGISDEDLRAAEQMALTIERDARDRGRSKP
jgi:hypothetical protein